MQQTSSTQNLRFIVVSLFLHLLVFLMMQTPKGTNFVSNVNESKTYEIELEPVNNSKQITKQVVETTLIKKSTEVAKDAFLGEQTQIVEKQTKAKEIAVFREFKKGGTANTKEKQDSDLHKLGLAHDYKPLGNIGPGQTAAGNDFIKDIAEGSQTMLNTKEFAFYSFYQRVRKQLEQFWEPALRERLDKMINRGRMIASEKDHSTRLMVIMNSEGIITKIQVENTSGLIDLDEVAVESFNKAGPFPNPPRGMVDIDGKVRVEWEFVLRT